MQFARIRDGVLSIGAGIAPWFRHAVLGIAAVSLASGFAARFAGAYDIAELIWIAGTVPVLAALIGEIIVSLRRGDVGLDIVAALAMAGALLLGENLAAIVVALMYAGGQFLENYAERRAGREMTALLSRVPRTALRLRNGGAEEVALEDIVPGDRILIRKGDTIPVDGDVAVGNALIDQAALTGESVPVRPAIGDPVLSGGTNVGEVFEIVASRPASESTFAGIVRLVEEARKSKAPMARLADRYAMVFLAITVVMAGGAWLLSGEAVRALAVLVVATPCPLILAVPVAIVSGMSRTAHIGVLVKGGKALEVLARIRSLVIDKTGTLTHGRAQLIASASAEGLDPEEALRLGASLDQASKHIVAQALVSEARARGLELAMPEDVSEFVGRGLEGTVEGRRVIVGGHEFVERTIGSPAPLPPEGIASGAATIAVAIDGVIAATFVLADELRAGTSDLLDSLRREGVARIVLASGDRQDVADRIGEGLRLDAVHGDLSPDEKIEIVRKERGRGPVMMIGDGVNDAPALASADLGVSMGATGAAASAEAADVVILVDSLARILPAMRIAKRARMIALQSVFVGIGLSFLGMIAAALGYLTPVQGALLQEGIDVAVILNALRALRAGPEASLGKARKAAVN